MPQPGLKPESKRALQDALATLTKQLEIAEKQVDDRLKERDAEQARLHEAQAYRDDLKARRKAIRQDLGEE